MKLWLPILLFMSHRFALAQIDPAPAGQFVRQYAAHYRISPELVGALIDVESRWNPQAVSGKGAMGLMQYERRSKNGPQSAARAELCGGVKGIHRRDWFCGELP